MEAEKVLMDYYIPNYILLPRIEATVNHDLVTYLLVLSKCLSILKVVASLGVYDLRERAPDKVLHQLYSNLEKHKQNGDSLGKNSGTNCSSVKAFLDQVRNAKEMRVDSWHILMRLRAPTEGSCDPIAPLELPHSMHAFKRVSQADALNEVLNEESKHQSSQYRNSRSL
nr:diacylglycerol kinase 5-like isoform X2 [Ipomoea batatas]GMC87028.1 diacylglycerol kinase 5-like isoform X2 [Ipomoea batatas]